MKATGRFVEEETESTLSSVKDARQPDAAALALAHVEHSAGCTEVPEADEADRVRMTAKRSYKRTRSRIDSRRECPTICRELLNAGERHCEELGQGAFRDSKRPRLARPSRASADLRWSRAGC